MNDYSASFKIILHAGNSKSKAREAIKLGRNKEFEQAELLLKQARLELNQAHQMQTEIIQDEIKEAYTSINMLMVHAQDHVSSAEVVLDMALEMNEIRKELSLIKEAL